MKVQQLLNQCNYRSNQQVFKTCQRILGQHVSFSPQLAPVMNNFQTQTALELYGTLQVMFQGRNYSIVTVVHFPLAFPDVPPMYMIKNLNPERF